MSETGKISGPTVPKRSIRLFVTVAAVAAVAVAVGLAIYVFGIGDRGSEAASSSPGRVELSATSYDPAEWGKNAPYHYEQYLQTAEITPTLHVSSWQPASKAERTTKPDVATGAAASVTYPDTRVEVAPSKLTEDPRLKTLFAGYAFAKDYRHVRGHEWMLVDQQQTLRVLATADGPNPATGGCASCHSSAVPIVDALGDGSDLGTGLNAAGWAKMNKMPYADLVEQHGDIMTPVACIDCHDPETMGLRITRPALVQAMKDLKGDQDYDVNRDATEHEMRSLVCAQCHSEFYFDGSQGTPVFPWHDGLDINDSWDYYSDLEVVGANGTTTRGFADYTNEISGARTIRANHADYEVWTQGVHASVDSPSGEAGVTCADCHMSHVYRDGRQMTNHRITSPMADVAASCGTCHTGSTSQLELRVTTLQSEFVETRNSTLADVVSLIESIGEEVDAGMAATEPRIVLAQQYQAFASYYLDYAYSANSYGFHAPGYLQRLLSQSAEAVRNGNSALMGVPEAQLTPISKLSEIVADG